MTSVLGIVFCARVIRCRFIFSGKNDELLRKSGPELTMWRDKTPRPP